METLLKQLIDNMYEIRATLDKVEKKLNNLEERLTNLEEKINIQQYPQSVKKPFKLEEIVYPDINYII
jgi:uncharacterized coiled-coil protein SlyX